MKKQLQLLIFLLPLTMLSQTQLGSDIDGEGFGDESGSSIGLSSDGNRLVIGAPYNFGGSGHARVYDLSIILSSNEYVLLQFSMYPNPVEHQFTIELKNDLELKSLMFIII